MIVFRKFSHFLFAWQARTLLLFLTFSIYPSLATAQTTTTYTYNAKGQVTSIVSDAGTDITFTLDDVSNITGEVSVDGGTSNTGNNGNNTGPTCTDHQVTTDQVSGSWLGITGCSDSDGDALTVTWVTDPPGLTYATISGNLITVSNIIEGANVMTRTVSDGNGGTVNSTFTVNRLFDPGGGGCCDNP